MVNRKRQKPRPSPLLSVSSVEKWPDFKEFKQQSKIATLSITPTTATTPSAAVHGSLCQILNFTPTSPISMTCGGNSSWLRLYSKNAVPLTAGMKSSNGLEYAFDKPIHADDTTKHIPTDKEYFQLYKIHLEEQEDTNVFHPAYDEGGALGSLNPNAAGAQYSRSSLHDASLSPGSLPAGGLRSVELDSSAIDPSLTATSVTHDEFVPAPHSSRDEDLYSDLRDPPASRPFKKYRTNSAPGALSRNNIENKEKLLHAEQLMDSSAPALASTNHDIPYEKFPYAAEKDQMIFNGPSTVTIRFNPYKTGSLKYDSKSHSVIVSQDFLIDDRKITIIVDDAMEEPILIGKSNGRALSDPSIIEHSPMFPETSRGSAGSPSSVGSAQSQESMTSVSAAGDPYESDQTQDISNSLEEQHFKSAVSEAQADSNIAYLVASNNEEALDMDRDNLNENVDRAESVNSNVHRHDDYEYLKHGQVDDSVIDTILNAFNGKNLADTKIKEQADVEADAERILCSDYQSVVARIMENNDMYSSCIKGKKGSHSCSHCSHKFNNLLEFSQHLDTFRIIRPFLCSHKDCPWSIIGFIRKSQWKRHALYQHTAGYGCPYFGCSRAFPRKDGLKRHLLRVHKRDVSHLLRQ